MEPLNLNNQNNRNTYAMSDAEKKQILLNHYDFGEICEIVGYLDYSNPDLDWLDGLEESDYGKFEKEIMNYAITNGNFEEVIKTNKRIAI